VEPSFLLRACHRQCARKWLNLESKWHASSQATSRRNCLTRPPTWRFVHVSLTFLFTPLSDITCNNARVWTLLVNMSVWRFKILYVSSCYTVRMKNLATFQKLLLMVVFSYFQHIFWYFMFQDVSVSEMFRFQSAGMWCHIFLWISVEVFPSLCVKWMQYFHPKCCACLPHSMVTSKKIRIFVHNAIRMSHLRILWSAQH
jgi:hypothetical protein